MDDPADQVGAMSRAIGRRRGFNRAAVLGAVALAFGCVAQEISGPGDVAQIRVLPDTLVLRVGDTSTVRAAALDATAAWLVQQVAAWGSSAAGVMTVDSSGLVRGIASGTATLTASIGSVEGTAVVLVSSAATAIAAVEGNGQSAAVNAPVAVDPAVRVTDANNTAVPGVAVTFAPAVGSGNVTPSVTVLTGFDGVARVGAWTLGPAAGAQSLSASISGTGITGNPVSFSATATVGPPSDTQSSIAVSSATIAPSSGLSFTNVTVTVRDAAGSTVMGATVVLAATGSGNVVTQPTAATNALGQATGAFSSTVAGLKVLSATVNGTTTLVQTATVDVSASTAAGLVVATQPAGAVSNSLFATQPVVEIRDAFGNRVLSASGPVTVSLVSGNGTLVTDGSFTVNAVNGRATFTGLRIRGASAVRDTLGTGTHRLQFSTPGFAAVTADSLNVDVSYAYNVVDVYTRNSCLGCHGYTIANTVNQPTTLAPCAPRLRIVAYDTLNSAIYEKIRNSVPACGGVMPPMPATMSLLQILLVRDWIMQGARNN
jgi:hypothetical protein